MHEIDRFTTFECRVHFLERCVACTEQFGRLRRRNDIRKSAAKARVRLTVHVAKRKRTKQLGHDRRQASLTVLGEQVVADKNLMSEFRVVDDDTECRHGEHGRQPPSEARQRPSHRMRGEIDDRVVPACGVCHRISTTSGRNPWFLYQRRVFRYP